jgi:hypothetical protein
MIDTRFLNSNLLQARGMSDARIAAPSNPPRRSVAIGDSPPPASHIVARGMDNAVIFPQDKPKYYIDFKIYNYRRESLMKIGELTAATDLATNHIILPMSEHVVDDMSARWEEKNIGWIIGGATEMFKGVGKAESITGEAFNRLKEAVIAGAKGIATSPADAAKIGGTLADPTGSFSTLNGLSPNQFLTLLYASPEYCRRNFVWQLTPSTPKESEDLRKIEQSFRKAMMPSIEFQVLWGYPHILKAVYVPNPEQLHFFRPMVIEKLSINWSPQGRVGFFAKTEAPIQCTIQMQCIELEYWTRNDTPALTTRPDGFPAPGEAG